MSREDLIELDGTVVKKVNGGKYDGKELEITAHPTGKIRMNKVSIAVGDSVTVVVSPYDLTKGSIIWRNQK